MIVVYWLVNGFLAMLYFTADHILLVALLPALGLLARAAPHALRPWVAGMAGLVLMAALLVPPPVPAVILVMAWAGWGAVKLERFNPEARLWHVAGGLALYALAGLGITAYLAYAASLDANAWAATFAEGGAGTLFAQGRPYLGTLASIALWAGLPGAYFVMLLRDLIIYPPVAQKPADLVHTIRIGGQGLPSPRIAAARHLSPRATRAGDDGRAGESLERRRQQR